MQAIGSVSARSGWLLGGALLAMLLSACQPKPPEEPPFAIQLYQKWELQPGDQIGGHQVLGGLGDIAIALDGGRVYAPFDGKTQVDQRGCLLFSSSDIPGYLFRLCGLKQPQYGLVRSRQPIGTADLLQFAALRKQPDRTWAIVEPSKTMLERTLKQP